MKTLSRAPYYPLCYDLAMEPVQFIHWAIQWRSEIVTTGNFQNRKDLRACSLIARNNPDYYKVYQN